VTLAVVAPLSAQFAMTSSTGGGSTSSAATRVQTVNVNQMLPKMNINQALVAPNGSSRSFDFTKLLPNFSFVNNRWPLKTGSSQIPRQFYGPYGAQVKKTN
jgi:hypothetical protein